MLPKVNEPIEIYDRETNKTYKSIVADITDEHILIAYPMDRGKLVFFLTGASIEVLYTGDTSKYKFQAEILGSRRDIISLYIVKKPSDKEIKKVQRREYVRMEARLDILCDEAKFSTLDISGGGMLCSCPKDSKLEAGQRLKGILLLPTSNPSEKERIPFEGKIIRIAPDEKDENKVFAMEFMAIDERQREKIIQYCFRMQLRKR